MELDYEKRLVYSPRKLEGPDRMIPPRASAKWQLNFDASPREQNENVYSCLLRNELLGENIEDVKQSTLPQRLFNYHSRYNKQDPNQVCAFIHRQLLRSVTGEKRASIWSDHKVPIHRRFASEAEHDFRFTRLSCSRNFSALLYAFDMWCDSLGVLGTGEELEFCCNFGFPPCDCGRENSSFPWNEFNLVSRNVFEDTSCIRASDGGYAARKFPFEVVFS